MELNKKIIFWGASKCGLMNLSFWRTVGFEPDFFTCNDENVWGASVSGIKIISPNEVLKFSCFEIYITSYARDIIRMQLISMGVSPEHIFSLALPFYASCKRIYDALMSSFNYKGGINSNKHRGVSFEYSEGDSLGGTQSWANSEQLQLIEKGISCASIIPSDQPVLEKSQFHRIILKRSSNSNMFYRACEYFLETDLDTFISMTGSEMLVAACFVKEKYSLDIKIIAFCHADTDEYYDSYSLLQKNIDKCFVISEKMQQKLIDKGFDRKKIVYYPWKVSNLGDKTKLRYNINAPLNIAYVGRVCIQQKRCDLLILLANYLIENKVDFILSVVGKGNYLDRMKEDVSKSKLDKHIVFISEISHEDVFKFWDSQDLYISCSEFEGHSLSQFEALSRGAVAVCTDCSGVSDDVVNGLNGYICKQGQIEQMAKCIQKLDSDRSLLYLMKKRTLNLFLKKKQEYMDPLLQYIGMTSDY